MVGEPQQPIRDLVVIRRIRRRFDVEELDAVTELGPQSLVGTLMDRVPVRIRGRSGDPERIVAEAPGYGIERAGEAPGAPLRVETIASGDERDGSAVGNQSDADI